MVVPVGFGVGDIIAFSQLVVNFVSAIREAKDAPTESRQVISSLQSLVHSLNSLASTWGIAEDNSSWTIDLPPTELGQDLANGIRFELNHCTELLQNFCTANSIDLVSGSWLRRAQKNLLWKYTNPQKLATLRHILEPHLKALELYAEAVKRLVKLPDRGKPKSIDLLDHSQS